MPTGLPHSPVATGSSLAILPEPKTPSPGLQGTLRLHNPQHGHRAQGYPPVPATCWTTSASTWVHQPLPCPGLLPGVGTQQWPPQFCPCPRKPAVWWGGGSLVIQHSPAGSTLTPCHTPSWSPLVVTTSSVSSSPDYANTAPPGTPPGPALPTPLLPAPPTGCPVNAGLPQAGSSQSCGVTRPGELQLLQVLQYQPGVGQFRPQVMAHRAPLQTAASSPWPPILLNDPP